jgi:uncharacterized protein YjdB
VSTSLSRGGRVGGLAAAALLLACLVPVGARAQEIVRLTVRPATVELAVGEVILLTAEATLANGQTANVSELVDWRSSAGSVARVRNVRGSKGQVTARAVGQASISVRDPVTGVTSGQSGGSAVVAVLGKLHAIQVTPNRRLEIGETRALRATGTFSNGSERDITEQVAWTSSNPAAVVVSNEPGQRGRVTALAPGVATISAASTAGLTSTNTGGDATIRVRARLVSVRVSPAENRVPVGFSVRLEAEGTFDDASTEDISNDVVWTSSDPSVATVSNEPGTEGELRALKEGVTLISVMEPDTGVTSGPSGGDGVVSVAGRLVALTVSPAQDRVPTDLTTSLTVRGTLEDGSSFNVARREVLWISSNPAVASVSNDPATAGVVTGVAKGVAQVSATHPGTSVTSTASDADSTITVLGRMVALFVRPRTIEMFSGQQERFNAVALLDDGGEVRLTRDVEFASSNGGVAAIDVGRGQATGVSRGRAVVSVVHGPTGFSSTQFGGDGAAVVKGRVVQLRIDPRHSAYVLGTQPRLRARAALDDGSTESLRSDLVWSTSDPTIAEVGNTSPLKGVMTPKRVGRVTISAVEPVSGVTTAQGDGDGTALIVDGLQTLAVRQPENSDALRTGDVVRLRAVGVFPNPAPDSIEPNPTVDVDMGEFVEFTSSDPGVARIENGRLVAVGLGETLVSARDPRTGIVSTASGGDGVFRVTAQLTSLRISPRRARVRLLGRNRTTLSVVGSYSDGARVELTDRVTFATADPAIAMVSNEADRHGLVEGVSVGRTTAVATEPITGLQTGAVRVVVKNGRRARRR